MAVMKKLIQASLGQLALFMLVSISTQVPAQPLSLVDFNRSVQQAYNTLKTQKNDLHQAVADVELEWKIIQRACDYSKTLKKLMQVSSNNQHLDAAKTELAFVSEMDRNFNQSFAMYGTSYQKSCRAQRDV